MVEMHIKQCFLSSHPHLFCNNSEELNQPKYKEIEQKVRENKENMKASQAGVLVDIISKEDSKIKHTSDDQTFNTKSIKIPPNSRGVSL